MVITKEARRYVKKLFIGIPEGGFLLLESYVWDKKGYQASQEYS